MEGPDWGEPGVEEIYYWLVGLEHAFRSKWGSLAKA
jgi:hypothetical protein